MDLPSCSTRRCTATVDSGSFVIGSTASGKPARHLAHEATERRFPIYTIFKIIQALGAHWHQKKSDTRQRQSLFPPCICAYVQDPKITAALSLTSWDGYARADLRVLSTMLTCNKASLKGITTACY